MTVTAALHVLPLVGVSSSRTATFILAFLLCTPVAGGASGRAGPRTIFVEGTGSSGNLSLSYRFYPEEDQEVRLLA